MRGEFIMSKNQTLILCGVGIVSALVVVAVAECVKHITTAVLELPNDDNFVEF